MELVQLALFKKARVACHRCSRIPPAGRRTASIRAENGKETSQNYEEEENEKIREFSFGQGIG